MMDDEQFNTFCKTLRATTYLQQWGGAHVWKVGGKVFAVGGWNEKNMPAFTFKTSPLDFDILSEQPGFRPAPYLAARGMKWIQVHTQECVSEKEIKDCLLESYRIVSLGLTKKVQKELGLNQ